MQFKNDDLTTENLRRYVDEHERNATAQNTVHVQEPPTGGTSTAMLIFGVIPCALGMIYGGFSFAGWINIHSSFSANQSVIIAGGVELVAFALIWKIRKLILFALKVLVVLGFIGSIIWFWYH